MRGSEEYVRKVCKMWKKGRMDILKYLKEEYNPRESLHLNAMKGNSPIGLDGIKRYFAMANGIKQSDALKGEIYTDLDTYFHNRCGREFKVICCPTLTGKTQFAFTLQHPTIYIPFDENNPAYQPFSGLLAALKSAAFEDLAKCFEEYVPVLERKYNNNVFDPVITANNIEHLLLDRRSYVLGLFKLLHQKISGAKNAVESTERLIAFLESITSPIKIKPISFGQFRTDNYLSPCFIVLDDFPCEDTIDQVTALFIRNILSFEEAKLILTSTSPSASSKLSSGDTIQYGSAGADQITSLEWATLYRRLPAACVKPIIELSCHESPDHFWESIGRNLRKFYVSEDSISGFESTVKKQLESSRPGLSELVIKAILSIVDEEVVQEQSQKKPFGVFVEKLIVKLNSELKLLKPMIFEYPGFVGSLNLAFPRSLIDDKLLGPSSTSHIHNHLFYLGNPQGKDKPSESSKTLLYVRDDRFIRHADSEHYKEDVDIGLIATALRDLFEYEEKGMPFLEAVKLASAPVRRAEKIIQSRIHAGKFPTFSEMPLPETELFAYLGSWGIGNSFAEGNDPHKTFLSSIHEYLKDSPPNDGIVSEALAIESLIFSSHYIDSENQSGLLFLHRLLHNVNFYSKSTKHTGLFCSENQLDRLYVDGKNLTNFIIKGESGEITFESDQLATKFRDLSVPYLGPVDAESWRDLLNPILPNAFGNVYQCKREGTGMGMEFEFEYFEGIEKVLNRANVVVKDHTAKVDVPFLREVLTRENMAEIQFLLCGDVTEELKSLKSLPHLLEVLEKKKRNLYYVDRTKPFDDEFSYVNIVTLCEVPQNNRYLIIIPFIPEAVDHLSNDEAENISNNEETAAALGQSTLGRKRKSESHFN